MEIIYLRNFEAKRDLCYKFDLFINNHEKSHFFHSPRYLKILEENFGYQDKSFILVENNEVKAFVPIMEVKTLAAKKNLYCLPFSVKGGILYSDEQSKNIACEHIKELAKNYHYTEIREIDDRSYKKLFKKRGKTHAYFAKILPKTHDELLLSIKRKTRAEVRKGLKFVEEKKLSIVKEINIDNFYKLYAYNLRSKGTPIAKKKFFKDLLKKFTENEISMIFIKDDKNQPKAVILSYMQGNSYLPYFMGFTKDAREKKAIELALFATMQEAVELKKYNYEFGRSKLNSGSYDFKRHWGYEPKDIYYCYESEHEALNQQESRVYIFLSEIWKKLPLFLTIIVGSIIAGFFP